MKWAQLLFDATAGVFSHYKKTSVDLAKIQVTRYYLEFVRVLRWQSITYLMAMGVVLLVGNLLIVLEVAILLYSPWSLAGKIAAAMALGLVGLGVTFLILSGMFSEKRWMQRTGADWMLANALKNGAEQAEQTEGTE